MMEVTSIRLPADILARLRALAHKESLRTGREVTWAKLVRNAVEKHLLGAAVSCEEGLPAHNSRPFPVENQGFPLNLPHEHN